MEKFDLLSLSGRQLKLFLTVYDAGSVGKAAIELGLNQSTVSYTLDKLRATLGDRLFIQEGRGILPTEFAGTLAPQIRDILVSIESLKSKEHYDPSLDDNQISIGVNVLETLPLCKKIRNAIREQAPKQSIRFKELGSRDNIHSLLNNHEADVVLSVRPQKLPSSLRSKPLFSNRQVCYFDSTMRAPIASVEEYCSAEHVVLDFGGQAKSTIENTLEAMTMTRRVVLAVPNVSAMAHMMAGTELICTMSFELSKTVFSDLDYCEPPINVPEVHLDVIWHNGSNNSGRNIWLRNLVQSLV